jgi:hypothetical protein
MGCPKSLICGGAVIIAVAAVDLIVAKATPAAVDTITPNPGLVNEVITFDASASFDTDPARVLVEYQWNFGDGFSFTSSLPEAMHVYDLIGDYTAALLCPMILAPPEVRPTQYRLFQRSRPRSRVR